MVNHMRTNMIVWLLALCFPALSFAISATELNGPEKVYRVNDQEQQNQIFLKKEIRLLSWQDDYLRTTVGTFHLGNVDVVDHSGMDLSKLSRSDQHPVVKFVLEHNKIKRILIYPASR